MTQKRLFRSYRRSDYRKDEESGDKLSAINPQKNGLQHGEQKEGSVTYVTAVMHFIVTNEIELGLGRIVNHDGRFRFALHLLDGLPDRLFVADHDVAIVERPAAGLRQRHQLAVHIRAEQMENDLEKRGEATTRLCDRFAAVSGRCNRLYLQPHRWSRARPNSSRTRSTSSSDSR